MRPYKRPGIGRALTQDVGTKVAALLLALFLWFNVAEKRPVEGVTELPLRYANLPANLAFASEAPASAKVRVRGAGRFMRWKLKDVYLSINLSLASKGMNTHLVSPAEVVMPADRGVEVLEVIDPKAVRVDLDVIGSAQVPVVPVIRGELVSERVMLSKPVADPARVTITGAQKIVTGLSSVPTVPIDVNSLAKRDRVSARLDLSALPPLSSDVDEVAVTAEIEPRKELGIPAVPVKAGDGERVTVSFLPGSVDLVVAGAATQIEALDPLELELVIDVSGLLRGQAQLTAVIEGGTISFDARPTDADGRTGQPHRLRAYLTAPYKLEVVSMAPGEIAVALR
jgi:YbbR domain-containing protein